MSSSTSPLSILPVVPVLGGIVVSVLRFQADDAWGGVAAIDVGVLLMMLMAVRLPGPARAAGEAAPPRGRLPEALETSLPRTTADTTSRSDG